jgi:sec-independent protein translocase protein TatA
VFNIGPAELIVVVLVALLVFGPKRLPDIGRTMGRSLQQFREATKEIRQEVKENLGDVDIRKDIANIRRDVMGVLGTDPPAGSTSPTSQDAAPTDIEATGLGDPAPANVGRAEVVSKAEGAAD